MPASGLFDERTELIVGRDRDLAALDAFVEELPTNGSALLLTGDRGMGKSMLLDATARMATAAGVRVARVSGTETAAQASFAGLDQLLANRHRDLGQLSPGHQQALAVALGMDEGPTPQGLLLANATLELLSKPTSASATLIVVDDLQWLDQASAEVLAAVARRLSGTTLGFIGASCPDLPTVFATSALPERRLVPLADGPAADLVRANHPDVADSTLGRLLVDAQANPLALIELPASLTTAQLIGTAELPPALPVTQRLGALFASRLDELPSSSRAVLLLAALERSGELGTLSRASRQLGGLEELTPAENAGIVTLDANTRRLNFRHPVARATVVDRATDIERRRAHRVLADAVADQPERRAWHLASTCVYPDEQVATLLETVGRASTERGDALGATAALTRAAELSGSHTEQGRRLVDAAYISAVVTGRLRNADHLLDAARDADPDAADSPRAMVVAANLLFDSECEVDAAHQLVVGALLRYAEDDTCDDEAVIDALHSLAMICRHAGRPELWEPFNDLVRRLAPQAPASPLLSASTSGGPVHQARSWLKHLDAAIAGLRRELDPVTITRTAIASTYVDRVGSCREALRRVIRDGREGGAVGLAISALLSSCLDDWLSGQWDEALELAREGVELSRRHGCRRSSEILRGYVRPLILAVRSDSGALTEVAGLASWAEQHGIGEATTFANQVRTLSAAGSGDFEAAYHHATAISPAGILPRYTPHALWVLLDVVESAVRTGRTVEASAHVAAMHEAAVGAISPRLALVVAGAAAVAADGDEATRHYQEALAVAGSERWPFDLARIELCFGEHLRRQRELREARIHLRIALDIFERLRAEPWVARAHRELRATGLAPPASKRPVAASLTPQELEIARLAAKGLSNKQIAERLYVSHRTVGARLYRMFPKLGITTRAGLRDALDALSPNPST